MKIATILTNIFHYIHLQIYCFTTALLRQAKNKGEDGRLLGYFVYSTCRFGKFYHFDTKMHWNFLVFLQLDFLPIL